MKRDVRAWVVIKKHFVVLQGWDAYRTTAIPSLQKYT
jgi:hypothetical protein